MKLVTFEFICEMGRIQRLGAVVGKYVVDLNFAYISLLFEDENPRAYEIANAEIPDNMLEFLKAGSDSMELAKDVLKTFKSEGKLKPSLRGPNEEKIVWKMSEVILRSPLPKPNSLRDFFSFEAHVRKGYERRNQEFPQLWYEIPVYYKGNHNSIIGPNQIVHWPSFTEKFDYELELACIIGKAGKNIPVEKADEYIAGYCILNDFSARDIQMKEVQLRLGPAKGKDFATGLGPWLVTPDEIGDIRNLTMTAKVNGEEWSRGNSGDSHWTFEQMLAYVSQDEMLYPGDILGSGTVGGGCGYELDRWVKPNDIIELEITNLGVLKNKIVRLKTTDD